MPKDNHHIFADGDLSRNEGTLRIDTLDGETKYLPVESVDSLYLHGQVTFNTRALGLLNDHGTVIHVFGWKDYYRGSYLPKRQHQSGHTVVEQVRVYDEMDRRMVIARKMIRASIHNMRTNVKYYGERRHDFSEAIETLEQQRDAAENATDVLELRGIEATAPEGLLRVFRYDPS